MQDAPSVSRQPKAEILMHSISKLNYINDRLAEVLNKIVEGSNRECAQFTAPNTSIKSELAATVGTILNSGPEYIDQIEQAAMNYIDQIEQELF